MWFPKFPYTNFSQINLDWVLKQIKELSEWMNRYFKDIRQDLDDEINNRIEGDKALGQRIDQEIADRTAADQQLQNNIDAEEAAREAADTALGVRIDTEIQDRTTADNALGQRIDTETTERTAADQQLQSNIDTETAAREAADQQLQNSIDTLRSDAILKDGSTTTTAAIPFAQGIKTGSISEAALDAGVSIEAQLDLNSHKITSLANGTDSADAVNFGQMTAADSQAVTEANAYTDNQIEAFSAEVHSIPAGGDSGQVLAKVDGTDYNVTWVDQQGGGSGGDVPAGGTTGQVLAKSTDADYQTEWVDQPEGLPDGGTTGQVVTKTADGAAWANIPNDLPTGGATGQILTKKSATNYDTAWASPSTFPRLTGTQTKPFSLRKTISGMYYLNHNPALVDPLPNPEIPTGIKYQTIEYDAYVSEGIPSSVNGISSGVSCEIKDEAVIFKRIRIKNSTGQIVSDIYSINNGSPTTASTNLPNIDTPVIWM